MSEPSDDDLDHLLSRGGLGPEHKQRLLQGILASLPAAAPARSPRRWRRQLIAALSLASGLSVVGLWWRPSVRQKGSAFRAKGAPTVTPFIGMTCLGGSASSCPRGARIAFWLEGGGGQTGFLTAYADPVGGGDRVWLMTNQPAATSPSGPADSPRVVSKAALLGPAQRTGRYDVRVVLSRSPVTRPDLSQVPAAEILTRASFDLVVSP
jgi:hypothetical protein